MKRGRSMFCGGLLLLFSLFLWNCGGSNGDSSQAGDTGSSSWDELKWNEDKWG